MPVPRNIIGLQLSQLRRDRGLSQPRLAAELQLIGWDVSRDIIARIENRLRQVSDFEAAILASFLGVPLIDLFEVDPSRGALLKIASGMKKSRPGRDPNKPPPRKRKKKAAQ